MVPGIGADGAYSHREYAARHNLGFALLADTGGRVGRAYGVLAEESRGHRGVPERATFVFNPDRVVRFAWSADGPEDQPDVETLRAATNYRDGERPVEGSDEPV